MTDASGARLADLLARLPTRRMRRRLVRCVPLLDFDESDAPSFLFTSGRPNCCNSVGVDCLYFSETEVTAQTEYRQAWRGTAAEHQPKLTFTARVWLRKILDLGNCEALRVLGLTREDFGGGVVGFRFEDGAAKGDDAPATEKLQRKAPAARRKTSQR